MGHISRKNTAGIIGQLEDDEPETRYCEWCLEHGFYKILQERVYKPTKPNEPKQALPRDHDDWLMCYNCGKVYAKWETKTEDRLKQFAEDIDSPFDSGKKIVGLENKKKKTDIQKQHDRLLKRIEQEPDEDIKRELKKGLQVDIMDHRYCD